MTDPVRREIHSDHSGQAETGAEQQAFPYAAANHLGLMIRNGFRNQPGDCQANSRCGQGNG